MNDDRAQGRFMAIQIVRISGVALVIVALLMINRVIAVPVELGYVLLVVGLIDALVMPTMLARRWKSPPQ